MMMMADDCGSLVTLDETQIKLEDAVSTDYDHDDDDDGEDEIETDPLCTKLTTSELSGLHQPVDPIHPLNQLRFVKTCPSQPLEKSGKVIQQQKPVLFLVGLPRSSLPVTTSQGGRVQRFFETSIQKNPGVVRPRTILPKIILEEEKSVQPPAATAASTVVTAPSPARISKSTLPTIAPKPAPAAEPLALMPGSRRKLRKLRPLLPDLIIDDGPQSQSLQTPAAITLATGAAACPPTSSKPTPPPIAPKSPAAESSARARMLGSVGSGRKLRPLLPDYTLADGPPHNEGAVGPSCQCVPCMRTYFEKLRLIAPARSERERDAYMKRLRRSKTSAGPPHEERSIRAGATYTRFHRKNETPEERERRLAIKRERQREREKTMTPERRAIMLAKKREQWHRSRGALNYEKREIMLANNREQKQRASRALNYEKREIMLAQGRERDRRARKARAEEKRQALLAGEGEGVEGKSLPRRNQDLVEECQKDDPVGIGIDMGGEVKEEVQAESDEDPHDEDIQESSSRGPQMRRRPKCTIETLRLEVQRRNALSKLRRLAETPERREQRRAVIRKAQIKTREKRKLAKERLGYFVPQPWLTFEQKIEQIAALEEAMKREEEEEKKFMNSYKYDDDDHGQDPCTICSVLVLKEDMGFHMKFHAEQDKKKSRQMAN